MTDDRKKPLWPWIVTLLIGLPALYVASFGPACWMLKEEFPDGLRFWSPNSIDDFRYKSAPRIYRPLGWAAQQMPNFRSALRGYAKLFGRGEVLIPKLPSDEDYPASHKIL